jgi:putative ABC transport system ATP-binding protein
VPETVLAVEAVSKRFQPRGAPAVDAVRDASLTVAAGESLVVIGPSGSGKTTLLSLCGALLRPDRGRVRLAGLDLASCTDAQLQAARLHTLGFVFQRGLLLAHLTARDNVALVPRAAGASRAAARRRADSLLEQVGVGARAAAYPETLSAGECQRVALARALVMTPRLVLADEPTAHLDAASGAVVAAVLRELVAQADAALVVVTHDARLTHIADRVLELDDGVLSASRT